MRHAAAGLLLLLAAACSQDLPTSTAARSTAHVQPSRETPQIGLVDPGGPGGGSAGKRNVFSYPAPAPVVITPPVVTAASREASLREEEARKKAEAERLRLAEEQRLKNEELRRKDFPFPYRYIGRFGPENAQLAAFVADGQATVVRTGDVLDGKFLVRAIGLESVEVSLLSAPELRKTLDVGQ